MPSETNPSNPTQSDIAQVQRLQARFDQLVSDVTDIRQRAILPQSDRLTVDASVKVIKAVLKLSPGVSSIELLDKLCNKCINGQLPASLAWAKVAINILLIAMHSANIVPDDGMYLKLVEFLVEIYQLPVSSPEFMQTTDRQRQLFLDLSEMLVSLSNSLGLPNPPERKDSPSPGDEPSAKRQRTK